MDLCTDRKLYPAPPRPLKKGDAEMLRILTGREKAPTPAAQTIEQWVRKALQARLDDPDSDLNRTGELAFAPLQLAVFEAHADEIHADDALLSHCVYAALADTAATMRLEGSGIDDCPLPPSQRQCIRWIGEEMDRWMGEEIERWMGAASDTPNPPRRLKLRLTVGDVAAAVAERRLHAIRLDRNLADDVIYHGLLIVTESLSGRHGLSD